MWNPFKKRRMDDGGESPTQVMIKKLEDAGLVVVTAQERDERKRMLSEGVSDLFRDYYAMEKGSNGPMPFEEKRKLLDKLFHIIQATSIPYGRGLDNPEYAEKVIMFIEDYWEFRDWKSDIDRLLAEAWMIVSYSWGERDTEPIPPIVIQKQTMGVESLFRSEESLSPEEFFRSPKRREE